MSAPVSRLERGANTIALLIAVGGAILLFLASPRFIDPIVDTGRDLYLAERVIAGESLYEDYRYNYPPVAPLLLAAFGAVAGTELWSFALFGAMIAAASALLTERIVRSFSSAAVSLSAEVFVILAHHFVRAGFNFAFPYSYSATVGLVILLALTLLLLRRGADASAGTLILATILAIAAALTKLEYGAAAFVALAATVTLRKPWTIIYALLAPVVSFLLFRYVDARWSAEAAAEETLLGALTGPLVHGEAAAAYEGALKGTDQAWELFLRIVVAGAVAAMVLALARLMRAKGREFPPTRSSSGWLLLTFIVAALWSAQYFYLSVIIFLPWLVWRAVRVPDLRLKVLLAGAVAPLLRVGLNFGTHWLGFALCVPLLLLLLYLWIHVLPGARAISPAVTRWLPFVLMGLALSSIVDRLPYFLSRNVPVVTSRGTFSIDHEGFARELERVVSGTLKEGPRRMLVIPEGVMLNYLTRTETPCRYYSFLPLETGSPEVESRLLKCLEQRPPQKIIEVPRSMDLFRSGDFGVHYNISVRRWIDRNYTKKTGGLIVEYERR